jgi:hypothetical protein
MLFPSVICDAEESPSVRAEKVHIGKATSPKLPLFVSQSAFFLTPLAFWLI